MDNENQDLLKIEEEIKKKQSIESSSESSSSLIGNIDFSSTTKKGEKLPEKISDTEAVSAEAGKMVGELFKSAVVHTIQNDESVKENVLQTAKQAITDKTEALKNQTDKEAKAAFFDNNQDACQYFGYDEKTTSKTHVKLMAFWAFVLNTIYICTFGFFIVSPLVFLCKKVKVIVKQTWLAFLVALIIYLLIVLLPILIGIIVNPV